jgi:hypothetical protein
VFAAGAFDAATADDALAVGEEDDLEQHSRRVGGSASQVVLVAGVEATEGQLVVDQVIEGVLEAAGQQLPFEIDGNEARAGVDVLVAGHAGLPESVRIGALLFHLVHSRMRP